MNQFCTIETPIGLLEICADKNYVYKIQCVENSIWGNKVITKNRYSIIDQLASEMIEYFYYDRKIFTVPFHIDISPFFNMVLKEVSKIKYGQTRSYFDIARKVGNTKATRAVGIANSRNPLTILIPCHRIIYSNGTLGGYNHGLEKKIFLLNHEGINISI